MTMTGWQWAAHHFGVGATGLEPVALLLATVAIALGYVVFGLTGFGAALVAMPLVTQVMTLQTAVPIMLLCDLICGLALGANNRTAVVLPELRRLLPWMGGGLLLGLALLLYAPQRPLLLLLGAGVLAYAIWRLAAPDVFRPLTTGWAVPLGLAGGGFTAMFGTGGPLYTIYLAGRLRDRNELRATVGTMIMLTGLARLLMFAVAGLFTDATVVALAVWLIPSALAGLRIGAWARSHIAPARVMRLLWLLLLASGAGLILRALFGTVA